MTACKISTDWTYRGMKTLSMENEFLRITCLPDFGARITEFTYKPHERNFLWERPNFGHRAPARSSGPTISFFDYWGGGWDELFPTAWACSYRKADYGAFGETPFLQWDSEIEKQTSEEVVAHLRTHTIRSPFVFDKRLTIRSGEKKLHITERLTNLSDVTFEFLWIQHPVLNINEKCRIAIPATSFAVEPEQSRCLDARLSHLWPITEDKDGREVDLRVVPARGTSEYWELLYFKDLREGWFALSDESSHETFGLVFPRNIFKFACMSMLYGSNADAPWYGSPYLLGMYPSTGYPVTLTKALKEGEFSKLASNESLEAKIIAVVATDVERLRAITQEGEIVQ
jgi:hypothetical protein